MNCVGCGILLNNTEADENICDLCYSESKNISDEGYVLWLEDNYAPDDPSLTAEQHKKFDEIHSNAVRTMVNHR